MTEIERFFNELPERRFSPALAHAKGVCRFDVADSGSWSFEIDDGHVTPASNLQEPGCVVSAREEDFVRLIRGDLNPVSGFLQGRLKIKDKIGLANWLRFVFSETPSQVRG